MSGRAASKYAPAESLRHPREFLNSDVERPGQHPNWDEAVGLLLRMAPHYMDPEEVNSPDARAARKELGLHVEVDMHEATHCLRIMLSDPEYASIVIRAAGELVRTLVTDFLVAGVATEKQEGRYPPPD